MPKPLVSLKTTLILFFAGVLCLNLLIGTFVLRQWRAG